MLTLLFGLLISITAAPTPVQSTNLPPGGYTFIGIENLIDCLSPDCALFDEYVSAPTLQISYYDTLTNLHEGMPVLWPGWIVTAVTNNYVISALQPINNKYFNQTCQERLMKLPMNRSA